MKQFEPRKLKGCWPHHTIICKFSADRLTCFEWKCILVSKVVASSKAVHCTKVMLTWQFLNLLLYTNIWVGGLADKFYYCSFFFKKKKLLTVNLYSKSIFYDFFLLFMPKKLGNLDKMSISVMLRLQMGSNWREYNKIVRQCEVAAAAQHRLHHQNWRYPRQNPVKESKVTNLAAVALYMKLEIVKPSFQFVNNWQ